MSVAGSIGGYSAPGEGVPEAGLSSETINRTRYKRLMPSKSSIQLGISVEPAGGGPEPPQATRARSVTPPRRRDYETTYGGTSENLANQHERHCVRVFHQSAEAVAGEPRVLLSEAGAILERSGMGGMYVRHGQERGTGRGKRHFPSTCAWAHGHRVGHHLDTLGGTEEEGKRFLGNTKVHHEKMFHTKIFNDFLERGPERLHFSADVRRDNIAKSTEEFPLGASRAPDLHTQGFLGERKRHATEWKLKSGVFDFATKPPEKFSLYGLPHKGKRKHFVENNLESGLITKPSEADVIFGPGDHGMVDLLDVHAPYEDMKAGDAPPPQERIHRQHIEPDDHLKHTLVWSDERKTAAQDDMHQDTEFKRYLGAQKRCFRNVHNRSNFELDYNDPSDYIHDELTADGVRWGCHSGRKKVFVEDHFMQDRGENVGDEWRVQYTNGAAHRRATRKHYHVVDHLDPEYAKTEEALLDLMFMNETSYCHKYSRGRKHLTVGAIIGSDHVHLEHPGEMRRVRRRPPARARTTTPRIRFLLGGGDPVSPRGRSATPVRQLPSRRDGSASPRGRAGVTPPLSLPRRDGDVSPRGAGRADGAVSPRGSRGGAATPPRGRVDGSVSPRSRVPGHATPPRDGSVSPRGRVPGYATPPRDGSVSPRSRVPGYATPPRDGSVSPRGRAPTPPEYAGSAHGEDRGPAQEEGPDWRRNVLRPVMPNVFTGVARPQITPRLRLEERPRWKV